MEAIDDDGEIYELVVVVNFKLLFDQEDSFERPIFDVSITIWSVHLNFHVKIKHNCKWMNALLQ